MAALRERRDGRRRRGGRREEVGDDYEAANSKTRTFKQKRVIV